MKLLSIFVVFTLAVGVYSNCGCLECNKNLHVISRPGDRVKIIYKNPCDCPSSVPYSIQIPVVAPEAQSGGGCYSYQVQPGKVIRPKYNPCPIARRYNSQLLFPVQNRRVAPLEGLSSSVDRVLLAGPSQSLPLYCPQPRIESIVPQRTHLNYYGYHQHPRYGQAVPKTPLQGCCNCCNCKTSPSNFCKSCMGRGQVCNCQNCNNCCNCKKNPSNVNFCKSCMEQGQLCNCQNCNNCCNCKKNPSNVNFCKSCMERGQVCNCQNFGQPEASDFQRVVSSKPTFVRIYRKMSAVPTPDMCTCQDSGPRILKIKPYHQVLLSPQNVKIVHRYEVSSFENSGRKAPNVFQTNSYEGIPDLQSRIGNAGRTPRYTFEDTVQDFSNPSASPICLNYQHMPQNGKCIRTMQNDILENHLNPIPSPLRSKPVAFQQNFEQTMSPSAVPGYGMKIGQDLNTFPDQQKLGRIENPSPKNMEEIEATLQAKPNNQNTDKNFENLVHIPQAKPAIALELNSDEAKEQALEKFPTPVQNSPSFQDINFQKPQDSQLYDSSLPNDSTDQPNEASLTLAASLNRKKPNSIVHSNSNNPQSINFIQSESSFTVLGKDASPQAFFHNIISSFSSNPAFSPVVDATESDRSKRSINYQLLASQTNPSPKPRRPNLGLKFLLPKDNPIMMPSPIPKAHSKKFHAGNWGNPLHKPALIQKTPKLPKLLPPKRQGNVMLQSALQKTGDFLDELFSIHNPLNPPEVQMANYEEEESFPPQRWWREDEELKPKAWSGIKRLGRLRRAIRIEDESMLPFYNGGDSRRKPMVSRRSRDSMDSYRGPSNVDQVLGPASIIQLMNAPLRYLSQLHRLGSPGAPIGAIPKVINVSKRYALELLKGLSKNAIRIGANVITGVGRLSKPKLLPKRRHRRSVPANFQNYEKLIHLLQGLIRTKRNQKTVDEDSQKENYSLPATTKSERRKREVEDDDSEEQFGDDDSFDGHEDEYEHMHNDEFSPFRRDNFDEAEDQSHFNKKSDQAAASSNNKKQDGHKSFLNGNEQSTSQKQYEELEKTIKQLEELLKHHEEFPQGEERANPDSYLFKDHRPDPPEDFEDFFHTKTVDEHKNKPTPAKPGEEYKFLEQLSNAGAEPKQFLPKLESAHGEFAKPSDENQPEEEEHFIESRRKREVSRVGVNKAIGVGEKAPEYIKFVANTKNKGNDGAAKTSNFKNNQIVHNPPPSKIMEVTENPSLSDLDIEIQAIEAKVGQLAVNIQRLKDLTFAGDCSLHDKLLKLQIIKANIIQLWRSIIENNQDFPQAKRQLLDKLKEAQDLKYEALCQISSQLSSGKSVSKKKLIRILVRLQKFHCIVKKFKQRLAEDTLDVNKEIANVDLLQKLQFTPGTNRESCLTSWNKDKDEELAEETWLQTKLEEVLKSENANIIREEAKILWEIKNVEKLQQVYILELHQKISQGSHRIRSELKILFDLQKQMDQCEEKQSDLILSFGGALG